MAHVTTARDTNAGRESAMAAVGRFIDTVAPVVGDFSGRKAVLEAALVLAQELVSAREVLGVNRRAGNATRPAT